MSRSIGVLLIGHGTQDPAGEAEFRALEAALAQAIAPQPVEAGFIELIDPDIGVAFGRLVERGAERIVVVPLLLFAAGHAKVDVPAAISESSKRFPHVQVDVAAPFGCDERIVSLSERRCRQALADLTTVEAAETYWLLVARGSRDEQAAKDVAQFTRTRAERSVIANFGHCFVTAARPTLDEGLQAAATAGAKRVVVQPHLLFRGKVLEEVRSAVNRWQTEHGDIQWVIAGHLGPESEVVDAVIERIRAFGG